MGGEADASFGSYDGEDFNGGTFYSGPEFGCVHGAEDESTRLRKSGDLALKLTRVLLWVISGLVVLSVIGMVAR